jgi:ribosomal protein S18 acetylase RimI-like enzyme
VEISMTVAVRAGTPAERAELAGQGLRLGEHSSAYVVGPVERVGAVAAVAERVFESKLLNLPTRNLDELHATPAHSAMSPELVRALLKALAAEGVRLVTCRRPESERAMLAVLQTGGFHVVECLLTLARPLDRGAPPKPAGVRLATPADAEACARIGAAAFRYDRFHADPAIDDKRADALKSAWARNAVRGRADAVFVTYEGSVVTGFNACLLRGNTAIIDLIGVAPTHQGRGLGRALTQAALAHFAGRAERMLVGTQSCNYGSLALYHGQGFRIESSGWTLHAHLEARAA